MQNGRLYPKPTESEDAFKQIPGWHPCTLKLVKADNGFQYLRGQVHLEGMNHAGDGYGGSGDLGPMSEPPLSQAGRLAGITGSLQVGMRGTAAGRSEARMLCVLPQWMWRLGCWVAGTREAFNCVPQEAKSQCTWADSCCLQLTYLPHPYRLIALGS